MAIGIFDSGIGGLTVFREISKEYPDTDIYYLGDTARVPYGNKSKETIIRYSLECGEYLKGFNIDVLVIACNTASSYALDILKNYLNIPVIGVVLPGVKTALKFTKNKKIGVIGTTATIKSNSYKKFLLKEDKDLEVYQKPCPLFVPLVEEGMLNNQITKLIIKEYLDDLIDKGIDTLILGCTHYPLLKDSIKSIYPNINIVDSSKATTEFLKDIYKPKKENRLRKIFITDESQNFINLKNILLEENVEVEKLELSKICKL
ncbi:MAG: glutamate racemase [Persephonella sp.]|nr:MAG: glutamate racemase [Persephonella sp.]